MDKHQKHKELLAPFKAALYNFDENAFKGVMKKLFVADCQIHVCSPFGSMTGTEAFFERVYKPLIEAIPDLERRDLIDMAGASAEGDWVGCCGYYIGVFEKHWLDIPPTYHPVSIRFHEFFRFASIGEVSTIVEMQAIWDIPQLMMQAKAWPLSPSLGLECLVPGPATQDGLSLPPRDEAESERSLALVLDMLKGLQRHAEGGEKAMNLAQYWHPKMTWYGPGGIGTNRRISGFRNWHQIPFLKAMPDRVSETGFNVHFFADGPYVAVTGWPDMQMTLSGDGWLGIPPLGKKITMRSLDFWRCENGLIRENWILVDLLHVYDQIGVDVFERMRECSVERQCRNPIRGQL